MSIVAQLRFALTGSRRYLLMGCKRVVTRSKTLRNALGLPADYGSVDSIDAQLCERLAYAEPQENIVVPAAAFAVGKTAQAKLSPFEIVTDERAVFVLPGGQYRNAAGHFEVAILDREGTLVSELSPDPIGPELHRIYGAASFQPETRIRGRAVVLTSPGARDNYYHWCLELLPKIHLLIENGQFRPAHDTFLINHDGAAYQMQTLALLGIEPKNVIKTSPGMKVSADVLVVPSHQIHDQNIALWSVEFLRKTFLPHADIGDSPKKVFLDRGAAPRRRITNVDAVGQLLTKMGYVTVDTAKLTFAQQIKLFSDADCVVAAHGAGLTNLAFSPEGATCLEIFSPHFDLDCYRTLSRARNLRYGCVSGVPVPSRALNERTRISEAFHLPLPDLEQAITTAER